MHPLIPYFKDPTFTFLGLELHAFGVLVATGFVLGGNVAQAKAQKFGGSAEAINRLIGWLVLGVFVGGHWGHLLMYKPEDIAGDGARFTAMLRAFSQLRVPHGEEVPVLLQFWHGLSSFGGFFVCVPLTVWFFRRERMPFWPNADALAIGFTLGWFFGRMGCFSAHDHAGTQTNFWLGVYGMCPGNNVTVACHDLGLYEALWSLGVFGIFSLLDRKPRPAGFYTGLLAVLYGPCRFVSDFFRPETTDTRYHGLTPAQYGSILLTIIGVWIVRTRFAHAAAQTAASPPAS
jgi:phosphatidylglycerol:prolipoprotein diacylglycerol transferase